MDPVNMWKTSSTSTTTCNENGSVQEKATSSSSDSQINCSSSTPPGPDSNKLKAILERTNYPHQVTAGQRKYGGPPPEMPDTTPPIGSEIFVGRIPKDVYEDELIPLFEKIGKLWDLRLMIDPLSSQSRGYAFITYCNREDAQKAVQELNGHKIRSKGYPLKVNISVPNLRLFIGNIPKAMGKEQIFNEFNKVTEGLTEVIIYSLPDDRKKNRGFCFLEFDSHKNASAAKRKLTTTGMKIFKSDILVDWADPQEEPDEETMSKVKVLYVRNLSSDVSENELKELFEEYGPVERVKKIKDYAFVHFEDRTQALNAMNNLNDKDFCGTNIEISLAKPPSDRKKKEEVLRNRERRMIMMMQQKQLMMTYPRVPQSQIRPPISSIPPLAATPILPMSRNVRNRFPQPFNPMLPVTFNRQNPNAWNPLMFYDPSDWWYGASNRPGPHHQFNFPCSNVPPNAAAAAAAAAAATQWNAYGLTNGGQVPPTMSPYCPTNANGPQNTNRRSTNGTAGPNGQAAAAAAAAAAMMNAAATGTVLATSNNGSHSMSNPSNRKWRGKSNQNNTTLINSNNINKRQ